MIDKTISGNGETREGQRIAKVMARAGLCSRREAEAWIQNDACLGNAGALGDR